MAVISVNPAEFQTFNQLLNGRITGSNATTTSNVIGSVTGMSFPIAANEVWSFEFYLQNGCNNTGGIKWGINGPSGATVLAEIIGASSGATAMQSNTLTALNTLSSNAYNTVNASTLFTHITGVMVNSSTAGTVQLQFASGTNTQTSTVFINSYFIARRVS